MVSRHSIDALWCSKYGPATFDRFAVDSALKANSGVKAMDEDNKNLMSCIDFNRIKGGKSFNINTNWFIEILNEIGQK